MTSDSRALAKMERPGLDLTTYNPQDFNVLAPISTVGQAADYVEQRAVVVKLDADPNKGDCYAAPGTRWERDAKGELLPVHVAPAKPGLMKLAAAMGVVWRVEQLKPRSHHLVGDMAAAVGSSGLKDLFEQVRYDVAYRAQVAIRDGLGWRFVEASYEWELASQTRKVKRDARKAQQKAQKNNKAFDFDSYVNERLDQIISDRFALAETKAILRGIRATGIRQQYTREEFGKPFVVQRVDLRPDTNDPAVRVAIAQKAVQSGSEIFSGASGVATPTALPAEASEVPDFEEAEREGRVERVTPGDDDAVRSEVVNGDDEDGPDAPDPWAKQEPTRESVVEQVRALWTAAYNAHQAGTIKEMPPSAPAQDASLEDLQSWCHSTTAFLADAAQKDGAG